MSEITAGVVPEAATCPPGATDSDETQRDQAAALESPGTPDTPEAPQAAVPDRDPGLGRWRASLRFGLVAWLSGLLAYVLVTAVSWLPFEQLKEPPKNLGEVLGNWHRWDTTWYVIIADSGYRYDKNSAAFFPLYPLLIRAVNRVFPGGGFEAALVVSILACFAALVLVHRFTAEILGAEMARRTTFYLLAFPSGFLLAAAYNESLFIALAVGSLYCMRRQRWWLAGVLAGFASGTRLAGALLGVAFLYEYLRQREFRIRRVRFDLLALALAPTGLLLYAWYCWRTFGNPLYFQKIQETWFRSGFTAPWVTVSQVYHLIAQPHALLSPTAIRNIYNLGAALGVFAMLILALVGPWRIGSAQAYLVIFSALDILMPLTSPIHADYPLSSMLRFTLECLPVFMVLAKMGRNAYFDRVYLMAALPVQGVMVLTFIHDKFVA